MRIVRVDNMLDLHYPSEQARRYGDLEAIFLDYVRSHIERGEEEPVSGTTSVEELLKYLAKESRREGERKS